LGPQTNQESPLHGSPLGDEEIQLVRKKLKWKHEPFEIPKEILQEWRSVGENGKREVKKWEKKAGSKLKKITHKNSQKLTKLFADAKNMAIKESKPMATRKSSEDILNLLTVHIPELIGGSADLADPTTQKQRVKKLLSQEILRVAIFTMVFESMQCVVS